MPQAPRAPYPHVPHTLDVKQHNAGHQPLQHADEALRQQFQYIGWQLLRDKVHATYRSNVPFPDEVVITNPDTGEVVTITFS